MLDTSPGFAMYSSVPNVATADEADLIRNVLAGRRDLFGALIASHLKPLSRMVRAAVGIHTDVEDVVQQTVLKALLHLDQFRFKASFRTWLIRIGINEARQWQRKSSSARLRTADLAGVSDFHATDDISSPLALCQRDQAITRLRAAFARLPDKYRVVIRLRDLEELSLSEVAQRLGLTVPAVKTRQLRARRKMAEFLGRSGNSDYVPVTKPHGRPRSSCRECNVTASHQAISFQ